MASKPLNSSVGHVSSVAPSLKAPWSLSEIGSTGWHEADYPLYAVEDANGDVVCTVAAEPLPDRARLIVAAPELIGALKLHQLVIELKATTNYADVIRLLEAAGDYESGHTSYEQILSDYTVRAALATEQAISKAEGQ